MQFTCPLPTALTVIPATACPFRFDQLVRMAFQRRQTTASFTSSTEIQTLANWTALLAATDSTKIVTSPIFSGMTIPPSEGISQGGNDNSTFNGIAEYYGEGAVTVTGQYKNLSSAAIAALRLLSQESMASAVGVSNLTADLFNKDGYGFCLSTFKGIPIYNFRVGSIGSEGLNTANITPFSFTLLPEWDKSLISFKPTFDPLTEI